MLIMIAFCGVVCWDGFIECVGDGGEGGGKYY